MEARLSFRIMTYFAAVGATGCGGVQEPSSGQPAILRTNPLAGATDVRLSTRIVVVFSEPIDPATATPARVQLRRGGLPVAASITFSGDGLEMEVRPERALAPFSSYVLIVSADLADQDGDRLEKGGQIGFTTGTIIWDITPGQYELSAPISHFDPIWGDLTDYRYTAVLSIERSSPTFSGTFRDMWLVGPGGDSLAVASSGQIMANNDDPAQYTLDLVRPAGEKGSGFTLTLVPAEVDSQFIKGTWGCCGHISGSFTAKQKVP